MSPMKRRSTQHSMPSVRLPAISIIWSAARGSIVRGLFWSFRIEDWQHTLQINLTGYFLCCRAALRFMRPQKFGRIVMFSSMAARTGGVNVAHYAASKGGILGLARSLAVESAAENIRVNTISPVITDTPMPRAVLSDEIMESSKIPISRWVASAT